MAGEGESRGERDLPGGCRISSLWFGSEDARAIIREGSGYWKYIPTADGIRFLTRYDYRARFGRVGALFDRLVFRPMIGWATAWSFDRLRLWLERGIPPEVALRQAIVHACARITLAFVFAYHGLVPKLLRRDPDEIAMLRDAHVPSGWLDAAPTAFGLVEVILAVVLLLFWNRRWPAVVCLVLMVAATIGVAVFSPRYLGAAFNPISLNASVAVLCFVDLLVHADVPSAVRCRRSPSEAEP